MKIVSDLWGRRFWLPLLLLCLCFPFPGHAQEMKKVSIKFKNTPVTEALNMLKMKTGYDYFCNNTEMAKLSPVTGEFHGEPMEVVLKAMLRNSGYDFRLIDGVIVIKAEKKQVPASEKMVFTGTVTDESGEPLVGATVILKGTTIGVATDAAGKFNLEIPYTEDVRLIVSFIGMEEKEIVPGKERQINIQLKMSDEHLGEVVVTGYGNISKESFTGNSIQISSEQLLRVSKTNVLQAIQSFDPSFRIAENNQWGSDPNSVPEVYIRGRSGIGVMELDKEDLSKSALENNPNLPTFILDGFEVSVQKVYDLDPNRIADITILKDAAATAMYGSRAANGVVVITTVVPQAGKLSVSYSMTGKLVMPDLSDYNLMNAREKLEAEKWAGLFEPSESQTEGMGLKRYYDKLKQIQKGVDTYWLSQPLRTVFNHKHSLMLEGGHQDLRFGVDFSYTNEDGVMKKSFRDRLGGGFFLDYRFKNLQVRNYISFFQMNSQESPFGSFSDYTMQLPYNEFKDEQGRYLEKLESWGSGRDMANPLYEAHLNNFRRSRYTEFINNLSLNWYVNDYLQFKGQFSITGQYNEGEDFLDPRSNSDQNKNSDKESGLQGWLTEKNGRSKEWDSKLLLMYNRNLNLHSINFTAGINARSTFTKSGSTVYRGFSSGDQSSANYAAEVYGKPLKKENTKRLFGMLATLNYTYNNVYLLDLSCRVDGSSEFGADKRFAPFWSGGVGINIHNYRFLKDNPVVERLKIRASYGQTGKTDFPSYCALTSYEILLDDWYKTGFGAALLGIGNRSLTWEKTNTVDAGFDLSLFRGLIDLRASWYNKKTIDLITDLTLPLSSGFSSYKANMGEVQNRGFELEFRSNLVQTKNVNFSVYANLSHNKNKILKISESLKQYNARVEAEFNEFLSTSEDLKFTKPLMQYAEGGSLTAIWGMKSLGIDPSNGKELFLTPAQTISYDWNSRDQVIIGDTEPKAQGAFGFNLRYKNFTLFTSFMYEFGGQRYNETLVQKVENADVRYSNVDKRVLADRWKEPGDHTFYKDIKDATLTRPTSRFVQDYNVLTLSALTLGYEFEQSWIRNAGLSVLRLEVGANDIFRCSSVEEERGLSYPYARSVNFTIKANF